MDRLDKMSKFGFIGCGNMGGAIITALCNKIDANEVKVADIDIKKVQCFSDTLGVVKSTNEEIAKTSKYIVLAVKPQFMEAVLDEISPILKARVNDVVLVSIAAGLSTEKIREFAKGEFKVIRVMPNTPAVLGEGMMLYTSTDNFDNKDIEEFIISMSECGKWDRIDEKLIDVASALSGCGPAFVYMFIEALADGAVKCGLPREKALEYAAQTVKGAALMVEKTDKHPELLKDEVCSPGGSTIAGVSALEKGKFRANCIEAVEKAYKRTLELGK